MTSLQNNPIDKRISELTGLETYKGLYYYYPNLYSYITDPLQPTEYFKNLVAGVIFNTGLGFDEAGVQIYQNLEQLAKEETPDNYRMIQDLLDTSYAVKYTNRTFIENAILVTLVIFLSFWIFWYLYKVEFFQYLFNNYDGIVCYTCPSVFDKLF
jgi:hypothetical protein